mmetsp:Transcript_254/g.680  ORF Transcript_254/g.680 Transcript_254/m.680 type:complete len:551 (+) Transcript_254:1620-3272(+)
MRSVLKREQAPRGCGCCCGPVRRSGLAGRGECRDADPGLLMGLPAPPPLLLLPLCRSCCARRASARASAAAVAATLPHVPPPTPPPSPPPLLRCHSAGTGVTPSQKLSNTVCLSESQSERSTLVRLGQRSVTSASSGKARHAMDSSASDSTLIARRAPHPGPPALTGPRRSSCSAGHLSLTDSRLRQPSRVSSCSRGSFSAIWVRRLQLSMTISSSAVNVSSTGSAAAGVRLSQAERLMERKAGKPATPASETAMQLDTFSDVRSVQRVATSFRVSSDRGRFAERSRCVSAGSRPSAVRTAESLILLQALRSRCVSTGQCGTRAEMALLRSTSRRSSPQRTTSRPARQPSATRLVRCSCAMATSPGPKRPKDASRTVSSRSAAMRGPPMMPSCCSLIWPCPSSRRTSPGSASHTASSMCASTKSSSAKLSDEMLGCRRSSSRVWARLMLRFWRSRLRQKESDWQTACQRRQVVATWQSLSIGKELNRIFRMSALCSTSSIAAAWLSAGAGGAAPPPLLVPAPDDDAPAPEVGSDGDGSSSAAPWREATGF